MPVLLSGVGGRTVQGAEGGEVDQIDLAMAGDNPSREVTYEVLEGPLDGPKACRPL